jgi:hypothetical protein
MAAQFCLRSRLPRKSRGSFTCRKSATWDRQLYFPSEGRHAVDFFHPEKIRRLQPGFSENFWIKNIWQCYKRHSLQRNGIFSIQSAKFEPDITIIRSTTSSKSLAINNTLLQRLMFKQQQAILPTVIRTDALMALRPHSTGTWLPHHRWSTA